MALLAQLPLRRAALASARATHPAQLKTTTAPQQAWDLEPSWAAVLHKEMERPSFHELRAYVDAERADATQLILPAADRTFAAFDSCPFDEVSVVVLGQDPYPNPTHAHGLAFSVPHAVRPLPGSLRNIYTELHSDLSIPRAEHGCLQGWAGQGVLLLNAVLSTRAGQSASHSGKGWERFTDAAISALSAKQTGLVFMLWGAYAQRKAVLIDQSSHLVLRAPHPSPLSARRGFFGSAHFSTANRYMQAQGKPPVDWAAHLTPPSPEPLMVAATAIATPSAVTAPAPVPPVPPASAAAVPPAAPPSATAATPAATVAAAAAVTVPAAAAPAASSSTFLAGAAPHQWWKQYAAIERARSGRNAPVDFLGCHLLGEPADGEPAFRFQTLAALMLSPRTQDAAVAQAMVQLRALAAPLDEQGQGRMTAAAVAELDAMLVGRAIAGVSFSKTKAERLLKVAAICSEQHGGDVPRTLKELLKLPGVGPKVGHLLMQVGWGDTVGIAVDTHVERIAGRLGWTRGAKNAEQARKQLEMWMPREQWQPLNPLLVGFGQQVCADVPNCRSCRLAAEGICPQIGLDL